MIAPRVIVDTNIVSYLFEWSELGVRYDGLLAQYAGCVSAVTLYELYFGAFWRGWGRARWKRLEGILCRFECVPLSAEAAKLAAHVTAARKEAGKPIGWADACIAATALTTGVPVMTHDRDFDDIDRLEVITALPNLGVSEAIADFYGRPVTASRPLSTALWSH